MKKFYLIIVTLLFHFNLNAQQTHNHEINFKTQDGVFGRVFVKSKPSLFNYYIDITATKVIIEGISNGGSIFKNDLAEYGVVFPYDCNNCFFQVKGNVLTTDGLPIVGYFGGGKYVHSNAKTSYEVNFNQGAIKRLKEYFNQKRVDIWQTKGHINEITISNVQGSDLGKAINAKKQADKDKEKIEKFNKLIWEVEGNNKLSNEERLTLLRKAGQYARNEKEFNKIQSLDDEIQKKIEQDYQELMAQKAKEEKEKLEQYEKQEQEHKNQIEKNRIEAKRQEQNENRKRRIDEMNRQSSIVNEKLYKSYNDGINKVNSMREEAYNMPVKYRFELDYKRDLLRLANELEGNLIKPRSYIIRGTDGSSLSSFYEKPVYNSNQTTLQAISNALTEFVGELQRQKAERERVRRINVNREKERIGRIYNSYLKSNEQLQDAFDNYKNDNINYDSFMNTIKLNKNTLLSYLNYNNNYRENDIKVNTTPLFENINNLKSYAFLKQLNGFDFVNDAVDFVFNNEETYSVLSKENKTIVNNLLDKELHKSSKKDLEFLFEKTKNEELLIKLLEANIDVNQEKFLNKIYESDQIKKYLKNSYKGKRITIIETNSDNKLRLALDIKTLLFGYVDESTEWSIKPEFLIAKPFIKGKAVVAIEKDGLDFKYYTIDTKNNSISNINEDIIVLSEFSEGFAVATNKKGRLKGYINQSFEWVIKPKYTKAYPVSSGIGIVKTLNGKIKKLKLK